MSDTTTGHAQTLSYYTNDLVRGITNNSTTVTYNLDPNGRPRTFTSSSDSVVHTNHYTADGDSPTWTSETTAGTTWNRWLQGFNGMAATVNQAGVITIQFVNVHGDVYNTVASTATNVNDPSYAGTWTDEYGIPNGSTARYDYLGTAQRQRDTNSGLQLMGERVYNPTTGRFLQTDPVLGGSANNYDYVGGDPVNGSDTSGRCRNTRRTITYANRLYCWGSVVPLSVRLIGTNGWHTDCWPFSGFWKLCDQKAELWYFGTVVNHYFLESSDCWAFTAGKLAQVPCAPTMSQTINTCSNAIVINKYTRGAAGPLNGPNVFLNQIWIHFAQHLEEQIIIPTSNERWC